MSDWAKFFETAGQLYSMWPGLFNWAAGLIVPFMAVLVTAAWWMRGYKAETREAALLGEIALLNQRLSLANEQQKVADAQAKKLEEELPKASRTLAPSMPDDIPVYEASSPIADALRRLIDANGAVSTTLKADREAAEKRNWLREVGQSPIRPG